LVFNSPFSIHNPSIPTFDFQCTACKEEFEKTLPFGSKAKPACPTCGSKKTEKLITMPSIAFKGSGFYKTDSSKRTEKTVDAPAPKKEATEPKKTTPPSPKSDASNNS
jgi:putative FmdB family regulatory protein